MRICTKSDEILSRASAHGSCTIVTNEAQNTDAGDLSSHKLDQATLHDAYFS
eukprot:m.21033 g.21033  ORF g.21033 m.21033 type:complete len:52 (+) comp8236_c1_seq2:114-269(+)